MVNIRLIHKSEYLVKQEILRVCFQNPPTAFSHPHPGTVVYVAEVDTQIVGTVSITITSMFSYIDDLAVLPAFQHRGIATQLVEAALKIGADNSPETYAVSASQWTARICKQLGFKAEEYGRYTKYHKNPLK